MSNYRRYHQKGACYFFTVVTYNRCRIFESKSAVELLRSATQAVMNKRKFKIDAMVVLPEHIHCIWQLPENDADYSMRWMLIKKHISTSIDSPKNHRGEKQIWQRRFWEHQIRDDDDYQKHMDYIHYNPVKHGYVKNPAEWRYSSFSKAVTDGLYEANWGEFEPESISDMDYE
jgi:putative transposase